MLDDIEDIIPENTKDFVKGLFNSNIKSENDYNITYNLLKKKYKLCPSKTLIRKTYYELISENKIEYNINILKYTLKKKIRSSAGVSVITILTSPKPKYTNIKGEQVEQIFSCGENCAYCPDEPEIRINMNIKEINYKKKIIKVNTNDDIRVIRLLTYILKNDDKYNVDFCSGFEENEFLILMKESINDLKVNDNIIGVKIAQPRSYLNTEPAVLRANRLNFDPVLQIYDRTDTLEKCGHIVDKIELLVLGGTWDHYPKLYRDEFIRDIYYSINTLDTREKRKRKSLIDEIKISEKSKRRIIGLTLETRPDCINMRQIKKMREYNVTRLQIGVQHIDDDVLEYIERGCYTNYTIKGTNLWKKNGGKIDWHLMPDLPGSSKEKDIKMFQKILSVKKIEKKEREKV